MLPPTCRFSDASCRSRSRSTSAALRRAPSTLQETAPPRSQRHTHTQPGDNHPTALTSATRQGCTGHGVGCRHVHPHLARVASSSERAAASRAPASASRSRSLSWLSADVCSYTAICAHGHAPPTRHGDHCAQQGPHPVAHTAARWPHSVLSGKPGAASLATEAPPPPPERPSVASEHSQQGGLHKLSRTLTPPCACPQRPWGSLGGHRAQQQ